MKKHSLILLVLILFCLNVPTLSAGDQLYLNYSIPSKLVYPLDDEDIGRFQLIHKDSSVGMFVHEWIPEGQSLRKWDEMITIGFMKKADTNMQDLEKSLRASFDNTYGILPFNVETVKSEPGELIMTVFIPYTFNANSMFFTIYRYIAVPDGIHYILYETKTDVRESNLKQWLGKIQSAYIAGDSDLQKLSLNSKSSNIADDFNNVLTGELNVNDKVFFNVPENDVDCYKVVANERNEDGIYMKWIPRNRPQRNPREEIEVRFEKMTDDCEEITAVEFAESYKNSLTSVNPSYDFSINVLPVDVDDVLIQMVYLGKRKGEKLRAVFLRRFHTDDGCYTLTYTIYPQKNGNIAGSIEKWNTALCNATLATREHFPEEINLNIDTFFEDVLSYRKNKWSLIKKQPSRKGVYLKEWIPCTQNPGNLKDSFLIGYHYVDVEEDFTSSLFEDLAKKYANFMSKGKSHTMNIIEKGDDFIFYEIYAPYGAAGGGLKYCLRYEFLTEGNKHWVACVGKDKKMNDREKQCWIEGIKRGSKSKYTESNI